MNAPPHRIALPVSRPTRLEPLLERRRSERSFGTGLALADLAALLWSGYGRRQDTGGVTPSAHALHRLALTVVAGEVDDLAPGIFDYSPTDHTLSAGSVGDHRTTIARTTLADQTWLGGAPALLIITADIEALNEHFAQQPPLGHRGERYAWLEAGHISQNLYLAAADLELAIVLVAGFNDDSLVDCLTRLQPGGPDDNRPLGVIAVGNRPPSSA